MKHLWFRIHLSTGLVLLLVAAGLVWANTQSPWRWPPFAYDQRNYSLQEYGWPAKLLRQDSKGGWKLYPLAASVNLLVALIVLAAVAVPCEVLVRRQVRRDSLLVGVSIGLLWTYLNILPIERPAEAGPFTYKRYGIPYAIAQDERHDDLVLRVDYPAGLLGNAAMGLAICFSVVLLCERYLPRWDDA